MCLFPPSLVYCTLPQGAPVGDLVSHSKGDKLVSCSPLVPRGSRMTQSARLLKNPLQYAQRWPLAEALWCNLIFGAHKSKLRVLKKVCSGG